MCSCATALFLLGLLATQAGATAPGTNGPIAFSAYGKIYTVMADGSGLHQVVREDEEHKEDFFPSWAPDGLRIVTSGHFRDSDGYWSGTGLQLFNPDGSGFMHLPSYGYSSEPAWSPDGSRIIFTRESQILSTPPDGATVDPINKFGGFQPAWSPDGRRIVFVKETGEELDTELYTMAADGSEVRKLIGLSGRLTSPSWSPDGSMVAFTFSPREPNPDPQPGSLPYVYTGAFIYVVPATGGMPVKLTESGADSDPVWSPDGSMIAFQSDRLEPPDVYLMNADGSDEHRLTFIHCLQCGPDWASVPPHPQSVPPQENRAVEKRRQAFTRLSMSRRRFSPAASVRIRFRAAIAEKVMLTVRRIGSAMSAPRCGRPKVRVACRLVGGTEVSAREGANRTALQRLLRSPLKPGRYWLQVSSSTGPAHAGLSFKVKGGLSQ